MHVLEQVLGIHGEWAKDRDCPYGDLSHSQRLVIISKAHNLKALIILVTLSSALCDYLILI